MRISTTDIVEPSTRRDDSHTLLGAAPAKRPAAEATTNVVYREESALNRQINGRTMHAQTGSPIQTLTKNEETQQINEIAGEWPTWGTLLTILAMSTAALAFAHFFLFR